MLKFYTTVGVSMRNNVYKLRFSNDNIAKRFYKLKASNNTQIILYALAEPTLRSIAAQTCRDNIDNNVCSPYTSACFNFEVAQSTHFKI
jgi:hypothetical protein